MLAAVVTDKRVWAHLEPGRPVPAARPPVVEATVTVPARGAVESFALVPDGAFDPSYRRFVLILERTLGDQSGAFTLRVTDRTTGEERCRFAGLTGLPNSANGQSPAAANLHLAAASGSRVLVALGPTAYCFDLADRRELWRANLLGKSAPTAAQMTVEAGGDVVYKYDDGWAFRLGRSAVLQPTYAALVTRDGLKALDPATGQDLWVRTNFSAKAFVFGDAKYLFLVDGKKSIVLRAADGTPVEGVPDFAAQATGPRLAVVGRNLLLDTPVDDVVTLRLVDPLTGRAVWSRPVPKGSRVVKSAEPTLIGVLTAAGRFEVLATADGKSIMTGQVDAALLPDPAAGGGRNGVASQDAPLMLADAERVYLILAGRDPAGQFMRINAFQAVLRSQFVNGPVVAFDRATGGRLWYNADVLSNQRLFLERFADLPVLVAAASVVSQSTGTQQFRVVVIDKKTGLLRYAHSSGQLTGDFSSVVIDPKARTADFVKYDTRLRITVAADGPALAVKPTPAKPAAPETQR